MLDDYEEGVLTGRIKYRRYWWELWKPNYIEEDIGSYTKIGKTIQLNIKIGDILISGYSVNGTMSGVITGLPGQNTPQD